MKIPKSFTMPGGYRVKVKQLTDTQALDEMGEAWAEWDADTHEILLRKNRMVKDKAEDFIHECEHMFVDWKDWYLGKSEHE